VTKLDDLERRVRRIEAAISSSSFISLPPTTSAAISQEELARIEESAARTRELAAARPRYEHDGTVIEPPAA
jgi:hypothetical protein